MGIKSKRISGVKENIRVLFNSWSHEFHLPKRPSKRKPIEVSWPQSVVKTAEGGSTIERPIQIQNQHERILNHPGRNNTSAAVEHAENLPFHNSIDAETESSVPAHAPVTAGFREAGESKVRNSGHGNRASIHGTSIQEWIPEQRTSRRYSAPQITPSVSKLRPLISELRPSPRNPVLNPPSEALPRTHKRTERPRRPKNPVPDSNSLEELLPTRSTLQPDSNNLLSIPAKSAKPRRQFVLPRAIAVKRDSWRYSIDAAVACNNERTQNRYSMPGDGFSNLLQLNEIRDPEALEKIAKLRQDGVSRKNDPRTAEGIRPRGVAFNTYAETRKQIPEPLETTRHFRGPDTMRTNYPTYIAEGSGEIPPPQRDAVDSAQAGAPSKDAELVDAACLSIPLENPGTCPEAPDSRPSTNSSNIRTPRAYCGLSHDIVDRTEVRVLPKETKAEYTERGRGAVFERWIDRDRLLQRRKESKGVERKDEEGVIWRGADILLGKAKYAPGPAIVRDFPVRALKPAPVPPLPNHIEEQSLPPRSARLFKSRHPLPPPPRNSPVESNFSDLLSTSRYPHRMPGSSEYFPPPPSCAIVSHSTSINPDTRSSSRTVTPPMVFSAVSRQPGPWDIPDLRGPPRKTELTSSVAKGLLFKYVRRALHPMHSRNRDRRLAESQLYFTKEPPRNVHINDLKDTVGYALQARNAIHREGFTQELPALNRINLLRLIISKEFLPYPLVCKDIFPTLRLFKYAWPVAEALGLRPFGLLHFMHEEAEIMVFLSTEDDGLYLWSQAWDERVFGARTLIRAATTIDDCEVGILNGLHVLGFEQGGWLKIDGYDDQTIEELNAEAAEEEDLYGYTDWTKGLNVQM